MFVDIAVNKQLTQGGKDIICLADYVWSFWKRRKGKGTESAEYETFSDITRSRPPPIKAGIDMICFLFYKSLDSGVKYIPYN